MNYMECQKMNLKHLDLKIAFWNLLQSAIYSISKPHPILAMPLQLML